MFIISLDFELLWGVHDSASDSYKSNLLQVHQIVPDLLALFSQNNIACTWATVGALGCQNYEDFQACSPQNEPDYANTHYSPYKQKVAEREPELVFAPSLVDMITKSPRQELASHTFCHYYCLEKGQTLHQFGLDLEANQVVASRFDVELKSIVFPRNQVNTDYLKKCKENGVYIYRGNPAHWAYNADNYEGQSLVKRAFRLIDCYLPLSGSLAQEVSKDSESGVLNIPASLFFRPYSKKLSILEPLKIMRIKWSMKQAAKKGKLFHLWWHPHNFGVSQNENMAQLADIINYQKRLHQRYGFASITMQEAAEKFMETPNG